MINEKIKQFQNLVKKIHQANQGWHSFEISSRFLELEDKKLQNTFLSKKNELQQELYKKFYDMIEFIKEDDIYSIKIKDAFQFDNYKDACHTKINLGEVNE